MLALQNDVTLEMYNEMPVARSPNPLAAYARMGIVTDESVGVSLRNSNDFQV